MVRGTTQLLFPGMRRIQENAVINTKNKSHSVTAEIEVPEGGAKGVIVAQGGGMGGWSLYAHEGKLKYFYNFLGLLHFEVAAQSKLPAGTHQARMEFTYDGGGMGKGADIALYVDGRRSAKDESTARTPCSSRWTRRWRSAATWLSRSRKTTAARDNAFNGKINWVQIDIDAAAKDVDHLIGADERFMVAMARQ